MALGGDASRHVLGGFARCLPHRRPKALEALDMAVLAGGAVTSLKNTALLTGAEAVEAMKKGASIAYKPPS